MRVPSWCTYMKIQIHKSDNTMYKTINNINNIEPSFKFQYLSCTKRARAPAFEPP